MKNKTCIFLRKSAYRIFLHIGTHQDGSLTYQTQIATAFGMPITTINYWITKFRQMGYIDRHLQLTEKGSKAFKFLWKNVGKQKLRAHNMQIKFNVLKCPSKFPECFSKSIYQPFTNKRYRGLKVSFKDFTAMFYSPKKIICVLKDVYADSDEEISSAVQVMAPQIKEALEREFEGIKIGSFELARIQTMHIAVLDSIVAKSYALKGFTKENKGYAIDCSNGVPEIELTNPDSALRDIMSLLGLEEYARGLSAKKDKK